MMKPNKKNNQREVEEMVSSIINSLDISKFDHDLQFRSIHTLSLGKLVTPSGTVPRKAP